MPDEVCTHGLVEALAAEGKTVLLPRVAGEYTGMEELSKYLVRQNTVDKFASYANSHGLQRRNLMIRKSHRLLEQYINSRIIYNMLDEQAWLEYLNQDDNTINAALDFFKGKSKMRGKNKRN